ncbi:MAG: NAD(P)-dependent oxidoreductase [Chloroflexi bacterium OHK40]
MTTLVTGAAGFVGLNLVRGLAARGQPVIAMARAAPDAATHAFLAPVAEHVRFTTGDVRDRAGLAELARHEGVRRIVHAAAITSAEVERADPAGFVDVNLGGTLNVLEAARSIGAERVVLISSSALYGAPSDPRRRIRETDPLQISGLYTICKQAGEQLCRRYRELYGLSTVAGRLGTAYGPMERPTGSRQAMSQVYTLIHAGLQRRPLRIYGAERLRDVCHIDDVVDAFCALTLAETLPHDTYNVSAGTAHSLRAIAMAVQELLPELVWSVVETPEQADLAVLPPSERGPMDLARLQEDLGVQPRHTLASGLRAYLAWLGT